MQVQSDVGEQRCVCNESRPGFSEIVCTYAGDTAHIVELSPLPHTSTLCYYDKPAKTRKKVADCKSILYYREIHTGQAGYAKYVKLVQWKWNSISY